MTIRDDIQRLSLAEVAVLGLPPELLLALTSTDEQRSMRAAQALEAVKAKQPLTEVMLKQLAADRAVAAIERNEIRAEMLALMPRPSTT
jgi:hypothetical protein